MSDISEFEKIHSYVTWPDREKEFFPNGNVTLGALGFPAANESGVANDGTCECADGSDQCEMPRTVDVEFGVVHSDSDFTDDTPYFKATTHVDVETDGDSVVLTLPIKKLDFTKVGRKLTIKMFDDVSALDISTYASSVSTATLVKYAASEDPLTTTKLLTDTGLTVDQLDGTVLTGVISVNEPDNDFDLPALSADDIESSKFAIRVSVNTTSGNVYVYLSNQSGGVSNGVYAIRNGTMTMVATSVGGTPMTEEETDELLNDGKTMDNVGTCCGPHFRKTYSHKEVHDYVYGKVGAAIGFGVYSSVSGCQGGLIDWLVSSGVVDIGNHHGYPVYVNGFGLGAFYVGSDALSADSETTEESGDGLETYNPWLLWSYGTTRDAETDTNVSALPRDWPFTYATGSYNSRDDVSMVTLVKKGVHIDETTVPGADEATYGNLYQDVYDEEDPTKVVAHRFYNKHHFVLNQKYKRNPDGGYEVKPFFIQLPAPLDTEDGETYEITVSIQNQKEDSLPEFTNRRDLSAYYAAMSQPRVYVLGGRQQFSNKKMPVKMKKTSAGEVYDIDIADDFYVVHTTSGAYDVRGELLPVDTEVRANMVTTVDGNALPNFMAYGVLSENAENGATLTFNGKMPSDRRYKAEGARMYICGMAYLAEDDNPSDTRMGLVRTPGEGETDMFRGDTGSGVEGALDEFNNFYSIDKKEGHRSLPHVDRRYFLASVYQTATNTFPWRMNGRKKLQRLDRCETDITRAGSVDNIIQRIYKANWEFIHNDDFKDITEASMLETVLDYGGLITGFKMSAYYQPVAYGYNSMPDWKNLASVLRVVMTRSLNPYTDAYSIYVGDESNPVRQAQTAIKNFVNDIYNARLVLKHGQSFTEVPTTLLSIRSRTDWPSAGDTMFSAQDDIDYGVTDYTSTRSHIAHSTLRSLPSYVVNADQIDSAARTYPTTSDSILFTVAGDSQGHGTEFFDYYDKSPYPKYPDNDFASSAATDETGCSVTGTPVTGRVFSRNSIMTTLTRVYNAYGKSIMQRINDLRRRADVSILIKMDDTLANLSSDVDWFRPFTNLSYKDGAPAVNYTDSVSDTMDTPEQQRQFFAFDAVQMYRFAMDDIDNDPVATVSTCMPYLPQTDSANTTGEVERSKSLAKFIEKYVTSYGAEMPTHFYNGRRIQLKNGEIPTPVYNAGEPQDTDTRIYINDVYRVQKRFAADGCNPDGTPEFVTHYFNDNFSSTTRPSRDPNANYATVDSYSLTATVPPYASAPEYTNATTYTRVRMQFTFSQRAGRWYTTEYRQYPCNYLSPLYGNDALVRDEQSLFDDEGQLCLTSRATGVTTARLPLWRNSSCLGFRNYRNAMYVPYSSYPMMDITLGCVPYLYDAWPYDEKGQIKKEIHTGVDTYSDTKPRMQKLEEPWLPHVDGFGSGGIDLYPPANVDGGYETATDAGVHANFWSVREFIRPATSILPGTHIPKYEDPDTYDSTVDYRKGGLEADPTLYRMFDFPKAGVTEYHLPNQTDPSEDMTKNYLIYHGIEGNRNKEGVYRAADENFWFGYGVPDSEQSITDF